MSYGQNAKFGIVFQNSWGTAGSVSSIHFLPILSESIGLNKPALISESMRGIFEEGDSYEGANTIDGDIEVEASGYAAGILLSCIMDPGSVNQATVAGSVYTHTFGCYTNDWDQYSATKPSTVYKYLDTGSAMLFSNMNGSALELAVANGEFLKMKLSMVGGAFSQNSSTTAAYPTERKFTWDTASISFGGSAVDEVENLTIKLEEGIEPRHTLNNSKFPKYIKHTGFRVVTVEGTVKFNNQTEYQQFISQSERALVLTFAGAALTSGYTELLQVTIPKFRYEEFKPAASGPGEMTVGFTGRAKYDTSSGVIGFLLRSGHGNLPS